MIPFLSRIRLASTLALALGLMMGGCAEEIPGVEPPGDQVYFPHAVLAVEGATDADDDLLVVSTNFDQRYNAGRVHVFSVEGLVNLIPAGDPPAGDAVHFIESFGQAQRSSLRIDQFGGGVVLTNPLPTRSASSQYGAEQVARLLIASRGRNVLTALDYRPADPARLSCGAPRDGPTRFDCPATRMLDTRSQDPFSAVVATDGMDTFAVVGHIRNQRDDANVFRQWVSIVDVNLFAWLADAPSVAEPDDLPDPVDPHEFGDFGGVTGMTYIGPGQLGVDAEAQARGIIGTVVAVEAARTPTMTLVGFSLTRTTLRKYDLEPDHQINLSGITTAIGSRGMAYDAAKGRLYVSLRYQETADSNNAGIAVIDVTASTFGILSIVEVGEELGQPFLHTTPSGRTLAYVPDIRRNTIWILDVSTDQPVIVKGMKGVGRRDFAGVSAQVPLLASPVQIAFATVAGRSYGFVSNFANSTIAVIDVNDPDARQHRVIARLGRDIDAEGETEGP